MSYADRLTPRIMRAMSTIDPPIHAVLVGVSEKDKSGYAVVMIVEQYISHALTTLEYEHSSFTPLKPEFEIDYGSTEAPK